MFKKKSAVMRCTGWLFRVLVVTVIAVAQAQPAQEVLNLNEAMRLVLKNNPQLQVFEWHAQVLEGRRLAADQAPAYEVGLEAENILGTGEFTGMDRSEITLSLSSVIELGGKRHARTIVVDSRYQLLEAEKRAAALDLLGNVTRTFITTLSLQEKRKLAADATALAQTTFEQVRARARRGAVPEADVLRAKAALANAQLQEAELTARHESNKVMLASYWGIRTPQFDQVDGDLFAFKAVEPFDALYQRVETTPAIEVYAGERRVRDAELQLARSYSDGDLHWQVGIKRFEELNDNAFMVGISMPLFSGERNRGDVQTATAAREVVGYEREAALLALRVRLFNAYRIREYRFSAVEKLRNNILPTLSDALAQTRQAYERGRYRYVEWVSAQRELLDARMALIEAATEVLLNQTLIEQLTAQPLRNN